MVLTVENPNDLMVDLATSEEECGTGHYLRSYLSILILEDCVRSCGTIETWGWCIRSSIFRRSNRVVGTDLQRLFLHKQQLIYLSADLGGQCRQEGWRVEVCGWRTGLWDRSLHGPTWSSVEKRVRQAEFDGSCVVHCNCC
jgi:hypothetical protein